MNITFDDLIDRVKKTVFHDINFLALCLAIFSGLLLFGLTAAWPNPTDDGQHHYPRILELAEALRAGVIFPRWFPDLTAGYGEPVLNYYSPGFYYPPALLLLTGLDMVLSVRLSLAVGFALSAWWMFRFARLYFSLWPAIVSVICFQFFPYRMLDLFKRGAFPEFVAFMWLPMIAFYTIQAVTGHARADDMADTGAKGGASKLSSLVIACLGWAGLILTHNLTALMAALVLCGALVLLILLQHRSRAGLLPIVGTSFVALASGILLSAWYILPVLSEIGWTLTGHGSLPDYYHSYFSRWTDLFDFHLFFPYYSPRPFLLPIYFIPTVTAASLAIALSQSRPLRLFTLVTLLLTLGVVGMMTDASAWLWASAGFLLDKLQFPWRWFVMIAFGAALLLGASLESLRRLRRLSVIVLPLLGVSLSAYLIANAFVFLDYPTGEERSDQDISTATKGEIQMLWSQGSIGRDFMPIWTFDALERSGYKPWEPSPNLNAIDSVAVVPTRTGLLRKQFQVTAQQPFRLLFHQFYFPAWRVTVDGVQVDTQPASNLALTSVTVPSGTRAVELSWRATQAVWLGRGLTTIGWVVVFALLFQTIKGSRVLGGGRDSNSPSAWRHWPLVVWLATGAIMVVASSGITARISDVAAIGAEYDDIRLEGVLPPPPTRAGEVAPVQLTWFMKDYGEPMSAFVHLVDEAGAGISQHDLPPGGEYYTPLPLWRPGLVLHSTHNITIPASLPPGRYRLIAGLYLRDPPHESLVPMGADSSRLEIGTLEVLP